MTLSVAELPLVPLPSSAQAADPVRLGASSRIVSGSDTLREAQILANAIELVSGLALGVVEGIDADPGDIALVLEAGEHAEGYDIDTSDGVARVAGATAAGVFWGTQTLRQLLAHDEDGWYLMGAIISDAPRFEYRGVMLDVARHFFGVSDVKRYIDATSALKFNMLHLHLTDDQGWRFESESYPLLTEKASQGAALGDEGGFYTAADFAEIVEYAASRHMTVVPEIDSPSHTHAVTVAYPEFTKPSVIVPSVIETAEMFNQELPVHGEHYDGWCVGFSSLKINDDASDAFITEIFREVAAQTPGPYVHLGGDESLGTDPADYADFIAMATRAVQATGKKAIAWHEAGKAPNLAPGTIGQYWGYVDPQPGFAEEARAFVENGGSLIMSPADVSYLDMKFDAESALGLSWANGVTTFEAAYSWDPADVVDGVDDTDILGVEAPLWTETARTIDDVLTLAFPRAAAIAEIAWSPREGRSFETFEPRVASLHAAWHAEGIPFHVFEETR